MKTFYVLAAVAVLIFCIWFISPKALLSSCNRTKPKGTPGLVIGNPINYYDDSTLLFPVGCNYAPTDDNLQTYQNSSGTDWETKEKLALNGNAAFTVTVDDKTTANGYTSKVSEYRNTNPANYDIRNLLFMNKFTKQSYSLVDSGLHILSFEIHKEFIHPYVMYKVVKQDLNSDSLYTAKDIVSIYFSRPDGSNFTQLTPNGEDYSCYFYYPETNSILLKTYSDSNNDKKIAAGDESNFFEVDLKNPQMGKNIFSDSLRAKLKTYIQ